MDDLEQKLKAALRKIDPSPGFESKVLAAAGRGKRERRTFGLGFKWTAALAAAAMLAVGIFREQEHARGELAKARLMQALKLTSAKLQQIQQKVDNAQ